MSRTRRFPLASFWHNVRYDRAVAKDDPRDAFVHGYDNSFGCCGEPYGRGPKGYSAWGEVWNSSHSRRNKRWAKRGAAKVMRRRGRREMLEEVIDFLE